MTVTPHQLHQAFPDDAEAVRRLRASDGRFARLAEAYDAVNEEIHRGETNLKPMDDFHMEDLRKERLRLLDEMAKMLRQDAASA